MKTLRAYVSDIRTSFKMGSSDNTISDRWIASEVLKTNLKLVLQQLDKRVGWNVANLFNYIEGVEMEEMLAWDAGDVQSECKIARSKEKLPRIVTSKFGIVVQGVWTLDKKKRFKEITFNRFSNLLKLGDTRRDDRYFWIQDDYLYISDSMIDKVSIAAFFEEPIDEEYFKYKAALLPCEEPKNDCHSCEQNPLDLELKTLPKLADDITNIVAQKIANTYKRSVQDMQEDDMDTNK